MQLKRREFLGSLVAGTAMAGTGANDRIRAAVIGMGGRGGDHMRLLAKVQGVEVAAFCDPDETQMAKRAKEFESAGGKRPRLEPDLRRILEDKNIDVVTVACCNHWHALSAIWACQAGKHVYVEKPVAHDVFDGRQMVEASRRYNRIVQGGTQRRSNGFIRKGIQALRAGVIGDLYMARCVHFQLRDSLGFKEPETPPSTFHWDLWLGPARQQPFHRNLAHYNWHWFWDFGNGELGNNGVHFIDIARWGLNETLPVRVHSTGGRFGYRDQGQTPNTQIATYEFEDGKQLVCEIRGRFTNQETDSGYGVFFYGSEGYMRIDRDGVSVFRGKNRTAEPGLGKLEDVDRFETDQDSHFNNFFDAVRKGDRSLLTAEIEETYRSSVFAILGNASCRLRRELRFDPKTLKCAGDAEANRMLVGEYRKPFAVPEKV
ncbi:MAG: Gfo/Idh/MocA family protein [Acidobacteriota bacterium]